MVTKRTKWSYLEPFLTTREFLHLADISRILKEPHPTVRKYLNYFEKKGILKKQIKGRLTLYKLDIDCQNLIDYLVIVEKEILLKRCEKDLLLNEIVFNLHENLSETDVLIFGSATENTKKAKDIDILVTGKWNAENKLNDIEKKLNIKFHLINVPNLTSINKTLKKEIIKKHLIINGSEKIIKWLNLY